MAMNSLPGTGRELHTAAQLFPTGRSRLLMGDAALEPAVRDALQRQPARFISFATHGLLASETGGLAEPGLVLTPPTQAELAPGNDGYLSVSEIVQLQFAGAAVILSACNTATIEPRSASRSLNSLARAFQFAGANRIIASYWSVDDEATAAFMARFFSLVVASPALRLDEALQKAQADIRADPRWRSPAYWAAFGLIGTP
jgi:CHAT domain-containing protein